MVLISFALGQSRLWRSVPTSPFQLLQLKHPLLSAEHRASGVSRAPPAVHGAPAAGGVEVEQARRPNPGYR